MSLKMRKRNRENEKSVLINVVFPEIRQWLYPSLLLEWPMSESTCTPTHHSDASLPCLLPAGCSQFICSSTNTSTHSLLQPDDSDLLCPVMCTAVIIVKIFTVPSSASKCGRMHIHCYLGSLTVFCKSLKSLFYLTPKLNVRPWCFVLMKERRSLFQRHSWK